MPPGDKISANASIDGGDVADGDLFVVVDISDTTDAASGTTKKITRAELWQALGFDLTGASDGDYLVRDSGLFVPITPDTLADLTPFANAQVADLLGSERSGTPGSLVAGGQSGVASLAVHPLPDGSQGGGSITSAGVGVTETTLLSTAMTDVLPANSLEVGDILLVEASGTYVNDSAADRTVTVKAKLDSDTLGNVAFAAVADANASSYAWFYRAVVRWSAIGASGIFAGNTMGYIQATAATAASPEWYGMSVLDLSSDTTQAFTLDFTGTFGNGTAGQTLSLLQFAATFIRNDATL